MANVSAPFGFQQRQGTGSSPTYEQVAVGTGEGIFSGGGSTGGIAYNASAIYYGDPVNRTAGGTIAQAPGSAGGSTVTMAGVFVGCKYLSTSQKRTVWSNYWPGSDVASGNASTIVAYIINDPNAQFVAQSDSTGLVEATLGSNLDFNIGAGNAASGISGAYLISTAQTVAAYPWRLVALDVFPAGSQGTVIGPYNWGVVAFNNVETKNATAV